MGNFFKDLIKDPIGMVSDAIGGVGSTIIRQGTGAITHGIRSLLSDMYPSQQGGSNYDHYPEAFSEDYGISAEEAARAAQMQFESNLGNLPSYMRQVVDPALRETERVDTFLSDRFMEDFQAAYGGSYDQAVSELVGARRGLLADMIAPTSSLLHGEIPQDVQDLIIRSRAEMGQTAGLFGQAADYATARDLGRTSLDMLGLGMQYATNAVSPLSQSLLQTSMALMPPTADPGMMMSLGSSLVGRPLSASDVASLNANAQQFNSEMGWSQALSGINWDVQQQQLAAQQNYMDQMMRNQMINNIIGGVGTVAGLATGLPWGAMLGGVAGGTAASALTPISSSAYSYAGMSPLDADPTGGSYWSSYDDLSQAGMSYNPWLYSTSSPADGNYFSTYYE